MKRWKDKTFVGFQLDNYSIMSIDKLANKFSMSRSAMLRIAVHELLNNSKVLSKNNTSKRANIIVELLAEVGDLVQEKV